MHFSIKLLFCSHVKGFIFSHCVGTFNTNNLTNNNELIKQYAIMSAIQLSTTKVKYGFLCLILLAQEIVALLKLAIRVSF